MDTNRVQLNIIGAGCASCVGKIEKALNSVPGVDSAEMNFAERIVKYLERQRRSS